MLHANHLVKVILFVPAAKMKQVYVVKTPSLAAKMVNIYHKRTVSQGRQVHIAKRKTVKPNACNMTARTGKSVAKTILFKHAKIINGKRQTHVPMAIAVISL